MAAAALGDAAVTASLRSSAERSHGDVESDAPLTAGDVTIIMRVLFDIRAVAYDILDLLRDDDDEEEEEDS